MRGRATPGCVLLTADTLGGVWSHAMELARALSERDIRIVLAAMGRLPSASQRAEATALRGLTLHAAPYRLPWMPDPWDDIGRAGEWLMGLAETSACDLVHLSEPVFADLPWRAPVIVVAHSCVLSWHTAVRGVEAPAEWQRYRAAMAAGFRAADAVVVPSVAMQAALRRHYGVHECVVIRNGRNPARYAAEAKEAVVLTAGRLWDPAKNVSALAAVAAGLPWPVEAAGEVRAPDGAPDADPGALELLGPLAPDDLARRMRRAAIFAAPACYEPFGQSILEAALSECALVLGDVPSLRELWGGAAVFVPPSDTETLREELAALIENEPLRRTLGYRARRRGLTYSAERMAEGYAALYDRLLRAGRHPAPTREAPACAW
jgi:glycosyltransferase involved in cell wall biosynthesis